MWCRGIRGATTAEANTKEAIVGTAKELLQNMIESNGIETDDVACAIFTTTEDLTAEFPALAARQLGWDDVALLCGHEMNVPDGLPMCIRILLMVNTEKSADEIVHVYIKGAKNLRPEGSKKMNQPMG
ncbi:MAG: chorismate mutase [Dehalococcoidia bacterium]